MGGLAIAAFLAAVLCGLATAWLAFYLDLRRDMLVETGQLPRSTPKILGMASSTIYKVIFGAIQIDSRYVWSQALDHSADPPTRWWAPVLRRGVVASRTLAWVAAASVILMVAFYLISAASPSR